MSAGSLDVDKIKVLIGQFEWTLYEEIESEEEKRSNLHEIAWQMVNLTRVEEEE